MNKTLIKLWVWYLFAFRIKHIDLSKLSNIEIDGVDFKDYPDFVDSFIVYVEYDGIALNEHQIDILEKYHYDWYCETSQQEAYESLF